MLELPKTTEFNKRIPKQKFYDNIDVSSSARKEISQKIESIIWKNKIASSTMNIAAGKDVIEIEVFQIKLREKELSENVLLQIDRQIPYHILYLLEYGDKCQVWIGYKEAASSGNNAFKVNKYYHTEWQDKTDLSIKLEGLNIDAVYESFIRQIAGEAILVSNANTLKQSVEHGEQINVLKKQIEQLQTKIRKEKQINRQMQMNAELKSMKRELEDLING